MRSHTCMGGRTDRRTTRRADRQLAKAGGAAQSRVGAGDGSNAARTSPIRSVPFARQGVCWSRAPPCDQCPAEAGLRRVGAHVFACCLLRYFVSFRSSAPLRSALHCSALLRILPPVSAESERRPDRQGSADRLHSARARGARQRRSWLRFPHHWNGQKQFRQLNETHACVHGLAAARSSWTNGDAADVRALGIHFVVVVVPSDPLHPNEKAGVDDAIHAVRSARPARLSPIVSFSVRVLVHRLLSLSVCLSVCSDDDDPWTAHPSGHLRHRSRHRDGTHSGTILNSHHNSHPATRRNGLWLHAPLSARRQSTPPF